MESEIHISTDKSKLDVHLIHDFLSNQSYWANDRSLERVRQSIDHSLCFGVYLDDKQIGFARVVTDYTVFAWLMDVFILPEFRGCGYGKLLVETIKNDDRLQELERWGLVTSDAHELYKQYGFSVTQRPQNMMEIFNGKLTR